MLSNIQIDWRRDDPGNQPGVYAIFDIWDDEYRQSFGTRSYLPCIYVGQSKDIERRLWQHHNECEKIGPSHWLWTGTDYLYIFPIEDSATRLAIETIAIDQLQPKYNIKKSTTKSDPVCMSTLMMAIADKELSEI